ncbi:hypothetical protein G7K_3656-t1 [Saitoella complicata NRRL Y-17804]|uniref:Endonuclease/exonuclease/phosphatase domain-containing protein n=1 Tax=Saitoella complicata (strain BCRC 22490 / CBS 7301 / JCM 7358 / NBRC 10748 / NRRL Y-17804) TaxID=698492 RepID=A0A0E9NI16_SAICN|nr:hypothetical protein G7K_3656-t1 [Saitoella complicata NRRL Y-17804]
MAGYCVNARRRRKRGATRTRRDVCDDLQRTEPELNWTIGGVNKQLIFCGDFNLDVDDGDHEFLVRSSFHPTPPPSTPKFSPFMASPGIIHAISHFHFRFSSLSSIVQRRKNNLSDDEGVLVSEVVLRNLQVERSRTLADTASCNNH